MGVCGNYKGKLATSNLYNTCDNFIFAGFGKDSGKEGLVANHKEQSALRQQWKRDVDSLRHILTSLRDSYQHSKGGFAVGRYEQLKDMIKAAVKQYREWKPSVGSPDPDQSVNQGTQSGLGKVGLMARLRMNAESFASSQEQLEHQAKDYSGISFV